VLPRGHVAVVVGDYEATVAALRDAGHEVEARPQHWGAPRAYTRDPAGNRVELMAFPPGGG
jgi:catechol 2,3-dioxygenase-like lactoylglutathione lyase family enzyme